MLGPKFRACLADLDMVVNAQVEDTLVAVIKARSMHFFETSAIISIVSNVYGYGSGFSFSALPRTIFAICSFGLVMFLK